MYDPYSGSRTTSKLGSTFFDFHVLSRPVKNTNRFTFSKNNFYSDLMWVRGHVKKRFLDFFLTAKSFSESKFWSRTCKMPIFVQSLKTCSVRWRAHTDCSAHGELQPRFWRPSRITLNFFFLLGYGVHFPYIKRKTWIRGPDFELGKVL